MTVDLYAHYGTLAHEATPVYAWGADVTDSYDRVSVTIPARYKPYKTMSGELCVCVSRTTTRSSRLSLWMHSIVSQTSAVTV